MPSLSALPERHVVIDRRPGHYLCFPDVCLAEDGTLVCAYNEFDRHIATRRRLLIKTSADAGRTWGRARLIHAQESHCPRLSRLDDGTLLLIDDAVPSLGFSIDNGETWARQHGCGLGHGLLDRVLHLGGETLLTTGHLHRGTQAKAKIRQAPSEQMAYVSRNLGRMWEPFSVIAAERCLVLCEASVIRLPGVGKTGQPRLLALMRENSFVAEPMYFCISEDGGANWTAPAPTPLIGHRPTLGWTRSGKLLVTYRDVGPDPGTKAWLGDLAELCGDFAVHGLHPQPGGVELTPGGLVVKSGPGPDRAVRYSLRPFTDAEHATAEFEADVRVESAGENGLGIRLGIWWKLYPEGLLPDVDGAALIAWEPEGFHRVRIVYEPGLCRLFIDGEACGEYPVDPLEGDTRPILLGAISRKAADTSESVWRALSLHIREPRLGRGYVWGWDHTQGLPDAWTNARVLELMNDRQASPADFGYSGWAETSEGRFFCAYHHGGGAEPGYVEGFSAHVRGAFFSEDDFGVTA